MKIRSIFYRQVLSHMLVIMFIALSLSGSILYFSYQGNLVWKQGELVKRLTAVAEIIEKQLNAGRCLGPGEWAMAKRAIGARIWLEDTRGRVLGGTPPPNWEYAQIKIKSLDSVNSQVYFSPEKKNVIIVSVPVRVKDRLGVLNAYYIFDSFGIVRSIILRFYVFPFAVGIVVAIFLGIILARNITRSIADIAGAAARFSAGHYQSRTQTVGNDEIGSLGKTFNQMADSIQRIQATRSQFFSNISHDLKTPLSCIKATAEALQDGIAETPRELQCYLKRILDEVDHMSRLIQELIETVRIESGKMIIQWETVDIPDLLRQESEKVEMLLRPKNLAIRIHIATERRKIRGDVDRLEQVLDNLLSNAVRYSPVNSTIEISVAEKQGMLEITLSDHGSGIAEKDLPLIWERFYRGDKSRNSDTGGHGLGLFICRGLIEAMGGAISVQSREGEGTTFILRFPIIQ